MSIYIINRYCRNFNIQIISEFFDGPAGRTSRVRLMEGLLHQFGFSYTYDATPIGQPSANKTKSWTFFDVIARPAPDANGNPTEAWAYFMSLEEDLKIPMGLPKNLTGENILSLVHRLGDIMIDSIMSESDPEVDHQTLSNAISTGIITEEFAMDLVGLNPDKIKIITATLRIISNFGVGVVFAFGKNYTGVTGLKELFGFESWAAEDNHWEIGPGAAGMPDPYKKDENGDPTDERKWSLSIGFSESGWLLAVELIVNFIPGFGEFIGFYQDIRDMIAARAVLDRLFGGIMLLPNLGAIGATQYVATSAEKAAKKGIKKGIDDARGFWKGDTFYAKEFQDKVPPGFGFLQQIGEKINKFGEGAGGGARGFFATAFAPLTALKRLLGGKNIMGNGVNALKKGDPAFIKKVAGDTAIRRLNQLKIVGMDKKSLSQLKKLEFLNGIDVTTRNGLGLSEEAFAILSKRIKDEYFKLIPKMADDAAKAREAYVESFQTDWGSTPLFSDETVSRGLRDYDLDKQIRENGLYSDASINAEATRIRGEELLDMSPEEQFDAMLQHEGLADQLFGQEAIMERAIHQATSNTLGKAGRFFTDAIRGKSLNKGANLILGGPLKIVKFVFRNMFKIIKAPFKILKWAGSGIIGKVKYAVRGIFSHLDNGYRVSDEKLDEVFERYLRKFDGDLSRAIDAMVKDGFEKSARVKALKERVAKEIDNEAMKIASKAGRSEPNAEDYFTASCSSFSNSLMSIQLQGSSRNIDDCAKKFKRDHLKNIFQEGRHHLEKLKSFRESRQLPVSDYYTDIRDATSYEELLKASNRIADHWNYVKNMEGVSGQFDDSSINFFKQTLFQGLDSKYDIRNVIKADWERAEKLIITSDSSKMRSLTIQRYGLNAFNELGHKNTNTYPAYAHLLRIRINSNILQSLNLDQTFDYMENILKNIDNLERIADKNPIAKEIIQHYSKDGIFQPHIFKADILRSYTDTLEDGLKSVLGENNLAFKTDGTVDKLKGKLYEIADEFEQSGNIGDVPITDPFRVGDLGEMAAAITSLHNSKNSMMDVAKKNIGKLDLNGKTIEEYIDDILMQHTSFSPSPNGIDIVVAYPQKLVDGSSSTKWKIEFIEAKYRNFPSGSNTDILHNKGGGGFQHDRDFVVKMQSIHDRLQEIADMNGYTKYDEVKGFIEAIDNMYQKELRAAQLIDPTYGPTSSGRSNKLMRITESSTGLNIERIDYPEKKDILPPSGNGVTYWPNIVDEQGNINEDLWAKYDTEIQFNSKLTSSDGSSYKYDGKNIMTNRRSINFNYIDNYGSNQVASMDIVQVKLTPKEWEDFIKKNNPNLDPDKIYIPYDDKITRSRGYDTWTGIADAILEWRDMGNGKVKLFIPVESTSGANGIDLSGLIDAEDATTRAEAFSTGKYKLLNYISETDYSRTVGHPLIKRSNSFLIFNNMQFPMKHGGHHIFDLEGSRTFTYHIMDDIPVFFRNSKKYESFTSLRAINTAINTPLIDDLYAAKQMGQVSIDEINKIRNAMPSGNIGEDLHKLHEIRLNEGVEQSEKMLDNLVDANTNTRIKIDNEIEFGDISGLDDLKNRDLHKYGNNYRSGNKKINGEHFVYVDEQAETVILLKNVERNENDIITSADFEEFSITEITTKHDPSDPNKVVNHASINPEMLLGKEDVNDFIAKNDGHKSCEVPGLNFLCEPFDNENFVEFSNKIREILHNTVVTKKTSVNDPDYILREAINIYIRDLTETSGKMWRFFKVQDIADEAVLVENNMMRGLTFTSINHRMLDQLGDLSITDPVILNNHYVNNMDNEAKDYVRTQFMVFSNYLETLEEVMDTNPTIRGYFTKIFTDLSRSNNPYERMIAGNFLVMTSIADSYRLRTILEEMSVANYPFDRHAREEILRTASSDQASSSLVDIVFSWDEDAASTASVKTSTENNKISEIFFTEENNNLRVRPLINGRENAGPNGLVDLGFATGWKSDETIPQIFRNLDEQRNLHQNYPFITELLDIVTPFNSKTFSDTSVTRFQLDHFFDGILDDLNAMYRNIDSKGRSVRLVGSIFDFNFDVEELFSTQGTKGESAGMDIKQLVTEVRSQWTVLKHMNELFGGAGSYNYLEFTMRVLDAVIRKMI